MTGSAVSPICRRHSEMVLLFAYVLSNYGDSLFPFPVGKVNFFVDAGLSESRCTESWHSLY